MNTKGYYKSKLGEVKTFAEWEEWTADFFKNLPKFTARDAGTMTFNRPNDWFHRITRILGLYEVSIEDYCHNLVKKQRETI